MAKGDKRRPSAVSNEQYGQNYDTAFRKRSEHLCPICRFFPSHSACFMGQDKEKREWCSLFEDAKNA